MLTIDCPPQILLVSDNRKGLISNAGVISEHVPNDWAIDDQKLFFDVFISKTN